MTLPTRLICCLCLLSSALLSSAMATEVFFTATALTGSENTPGTPLVLTVTRTPASGTLSVNFTIVDTDTAPDLRATVGDDYAITPAVTTTGTLTFADQEASRTILLSTVDDVLIEGREYVRVRLTSGTGYSVNGAASTALVTIGDNDITATVANLFPVATEDPSLSSPSHDPGAARRGVMQVLFDSASPSIDKTIQATFAGTAVAADYQVSYRIGGGGMGSALGWTIAAYAPGDTAITITGDSEAIPAGTDITIDGETYEVASTFAGGSGTLTLVDPLEAAVLHGASLSIPSVSGATTYTVTRTFIVGSDELILASGYLPVPQYGDVFSLGGATARYVITSGPDANGTFGFRRYTGGTTPNTGLDVAISTTVTLTTMFTASAPGVVGLLVPAESTQVQFGVTPGNGVTANDGLVEGREFVTLGLSLSNDFHVGSPSTGAVTIADIDSKASIALTRNAVHPETTGIVTVTLTPPIPQQVTIPYSVQPGSTAGGSDYVLSGTLTIPANTATGEIIITPTAGAAIAVGGETVVISLDSSNDYQRTTGPITSATATLTILPTTGTVSVGAVTNGTEGVSNGAFTVTIDRFTGHTEAATVEYEITGSADETDDYTPLTGSVVIPANQNSASIPVPIVNDSLVEGNETVILTITAGNGYVLGDDLDATLTITDNEPVVSVAATGATATEGGVNGTFTVTMTPAPSSTIIVPFTFGGEGVGDFTASPTTQVQFSVADPAPKVVIITATDNTVADGIRSLTLTLSIPATPATYSLDDDDSATLDLVDNDVGAIAVEATSPNGDYDLNDEVILTVGFSAAVTVTGVPVLHLETGPTNRQATYQSGSGSDTLTFRYVVQSGDVSSDLDYTADDALDLAGGTITHSGSIAAILTLPEPGDPGSLGANAALVVDGSIGDGKPAPGAIGNGSGGGCGLGSGFATLIGLFMLAGFALSVRRNRT